jgi:hypothetical protein
LEELRGGAIVLLILNISIKIMIVINTNDDLDILLDPKEVLLIGYVKNPGTPEERRGRLETIAINSPITIGNPRKRILLECGQMCAQVHGRRIESYREDDALVLKVHGLWGRLDDPDYNSGRPNDQVYNASRPIQDRYDFENKAVIYTTVNLPLHLKQHFGVS